MRPKTQHHNPLHGVTLAAMLTELVAHFGWPELGQRIPIKSFNVDPSIASSLKFLRRTPWAREKVEGLYLFMRREQTRAESVAPASGNGEPATAPFGNWASPITAELIAGATLRLGQLQVRGDDVFWSEGRPQEQGRNVLVWHGSDGRSIDLTPAPLNVRSRVHEYGGGAFTLGPRAGFFTNDSDQQIWRIRANEAPQPLTSEAGTRHADIVIDSRRKRLICVREDHRSGGGEALNTIVGIKLSNGAAQVLAGDRDFYSTPRLSPDGHQLAWLSWDHPNMPWDGCELWLADIAADGSLQGARRVAGGTAEAIFQPSWSPRGELHFVSDRSGWWNLYRWRDGSVEALHPMAAEFGVPQWAFGQSTYGFDARGRIVCSYVQDGVSRLGVLDADVDAKTSTGRFKPLALAFCAISELQVGADFAVFIGGSATAPEAIVRLDLASGEHRVLRSASPITPDPGFVSQAEAIDFPTVAGLAAHAFFYRPTNRDFIGPPNERPPLIVISHGGPTGATNAAFKWPIQYWTSRGFAVVDVNYGGSSGHGRAYRERLHGCWGVVDVDDCVNAARFLIERGDVDPLRLAIRGSSAGGYTTLCALTFRQFFGCGASLYGVGDLEALALDTHKFESRYLDRLVGPYPAQRALYRQRSPVHHTEQLSSPMILLQGSEDRVVPPEQARAMFEAVRAKGLPVAFVLFEGEQHGFRRAATIRRALEAELYFYGRIFGFVPTDAIEPVAIENLGSSAKP
ncbi:MAG TPA: prolyl oligopeptidase family serine peptidase [Burkholderiaceae bacterium]|nr:prolyl oligopeptidase family serine peptidase [Burkholderiaceae bacterium]